MHVVSVDALAHDTRREMCALLGQYYLHVTRRQFERDLDDKEWVVLGTDPRTGRVWGFSTMRRLRARVNGVPIVALYSGDTVVRHECWGRESGAVIRASLRQMYAVAARETAPADVLPPRCYWFMISSTYKSYRLLSQLFQRYEPAPCQPLTREGASIMAELSRIKGFTYDAAASVVRFARPTAFRGSAACGGSADGASEAARYFARANPGAAAGDRLASLVELTAENLTPLGRRLLERP